MKTYLRIIDDTIIKNLHITESDIVEVLSEELNDFSNKYEYNVITSNGNKLYLREGQVKPLGDSLHEKIIKNGVENCFFYAYRNLLKICEQRYKVIDNYKISLGDEDFYMSDLESMVNEGTYKFLIKG